MDSITGLDRAVDYVTKIAHFRSTLEASDTGCVRNKDTVGVDVGRKYDRIYIQTYHNGQPNQKLVRYFVDRNSWIIYGAKSYTQINERRTYGTLDTVDQYDWKPYYGVPLTGTDAEKAHLAREVGISLKHKPRGRPKKNP